MTRGLLLSLPWVVLGCVLAVIVGDHCWPREVAHTGGGPAAAAWAPDRDPVCGMSVGPDTPWTLDENGRTIRFCNVHCRDTYAGGGRSATAPVAVARVTDRAVARDPVCRMDVRTSISHGVVHGGTTYWFCSTACRDAFLAEPAKWLTARLAADTHLMRGLPGHYYLVAIALVVLISFGTFELLAWRRARRGSAAPEPMAARVELTAPAWMRALVGSARVQFVVRVVTAAAFLGLITAGLFGNQNPASNITPLMTWTIWWTGLIFLILYFGKAWCYACPWDAIAGWITTLRFWGPRRGGGLGLGLRWPRALRNIWLAVGLFLFLTWLEIGLQITHLPRATAWVALGILGLSIAAMLIFDRKSFCRYGCLVGRISGLYALFAPVEMRSLDADACRTCTTMDCYRGNARGDGCPTFEFPRTMTQSTYCTLCTECVRTCPKDNVGLRLRPWGADLAQPGRVRRDEAWLALVLLSMTAFHGLTMTPVWGAMNAWLAATTGVGAIAGFTVLMIACLLAPALVFMGCARLAARWAPEVGWRRLFLHYAYALLPIALFYHLAHNAEHFLMEGPKAVAMVSDPMGWGQDWFGTAGWTMGPLISIEGLWILQILFIVVGHVYGLWITERVTRQLVPDRRRAFLSQLPMLAAMVGFSVLSLWLVHQPMEMRASAM